MNVSYVNNRGEETVLSQWPIMIQEPETLFSNEWSYETPNIGNKIVSFNKKMQTKEATVSIFADEEKQYSSIVDNMLSIMERDIYEVSPGKLFVNGCYLSCYVIKRDYEEYEEGFGTTDLKFKVIAEDGSWIEESTTSFGKITNQIYSNDGFDYPYDYKFDYVNSLANQILENPSYAPADFEMIIYGSCSNPTVSIGNNTYVVNDSLITGEYLRINSSKRTIIKKKNNGEEVNGFYLRGRDEWIFEKVPAGNNAVAWSGGFGFDITLFAERSEPKWT